MHTQHNCQYSCSLSPIRYTWLDVCCSMFLCFCVLGHLTLNLITPAALDFQHDICRGLEVIPRNCHPLIYYLAANMFHCCPLLGELCQLHWPGMCGWNWCSQNDMVGCNGVLVVRLWFVAMSKTQKVSYVFNTLDLPDLGDEWESLLHDRNELSCIYSEHLIT